MSDKIKLTEINQENWRYILYETPNGEWIADVAYSPKSYVDFSMLILLKVEEQNKAKEDLAYLIEWSDLIRGNYQPFLERALNRDDYLIE